MATYDPLPEQLFPNAPDPLLGDIGELEMRTTLAYDGAPPTHRATKSSRELVRYVLERGMEPGEVVIVALDSQMVPLNSFPAPYDAAADEEDFLIAAAKVAVLSGGMMAIVVRMIEHPPSADDLGDDPVVEDLRELRAGTASTRGKVGVDFLDYIILGPTGSYRSALDEGRI